MLGMEIWRAGVGDGLRSGRRSMGWRRIGAADCGAAGAMAVTHDLSRERGSCGLGGAQAQPALQIVGEGVPENHDARLGPAADREADEAMVAHDRMDALG